MLFTQLFYFFSDVTGKVDNTKNETLQIDIPLCKKYYKLIQKLEALQDESVKQIENLVDHMK